ncbi:MAG: patatin-like phospholipase family protein, partial [Nitrospirae bacterium]|nr:patatin-like phospholipase family protein [Nitrospirota bacterium]
MADLLSRLKSEGPKRILSLDGGGVRGIITLNFLEKIEHILGQRYKRDDFRLCDYFDLIGGTSTGALIAALLSIGKSVGEIKDKYLNLGWKIFKKRQVKMWKSLFDEQPLK